MKKAIIKKETKKKPKYTLGTVKRISCQKCGELLCKTYPLFIMQTQNNSPVNVACKKCNGVL